MRRELPEGVLLPLVPWVQPRLHVTAGGGSDERPRSGAVVSELGARAVSQPRASGAVEGALGCRKRSVAACSECAALRLREHNLGAENCVELFVEFVYDGSVPAPRGLFERSLGQNEGATPPVLLFW